LGFATASGLQDITLKSENLALGDAVALANEYTELGEIKLYKEIYILLRY